VLNAVGVHRDPRNHSHSYKSFAPSIECISTRSCKFLRPSLPEQLDLDLKERLLPRSQQATTDAAVVVKFGAVSVEAAAIPD
jgi:hypothetical protein